ncbi:MAG: dockerin type I repeat-containing protein [Oscillospiraceae bacterium]|nr:dockerin type I repeat-containing protein [Oscillospiraceae bacterium]
MKKAISVLAAGVMALSSLLVLGVSAEETYALGDVDMDGIITGHDTAMVSRYVLDDTYTLTEEQLQLADVNGDGEVNQADADRLYNEMQEYFLGNVSMQKTYNAYDKNTGDYIEKKRDFLSIEDGVVILTYCENQLANVEDEWTQVQKHLADVNLDGIIDLTDICGVFYLSTHAAAYPTNKRNYFGNDGQYYVGTIHITPVENPDTGFTDLMISGENEDEPVVASGNFENLINAQ